MGRQVAWGKFKPFVLTGHSEPFDVILSEANNLRINSVKNLRAP
jgi:hypothetical protein